MLKQEDAIDRLVSLGYDLCEGDSYTLTFAIESAEQYIKNFCNVDEVPEELYFVALDMAVGNFLKQKRAIGVNVCDSIDFAADNIKSITEGDVSITYNSDGNSSAVAQYDSLINKLCNRDEELKRFRKMRW